MKVAGQATPTRRIDVEKTIVELAHTLMRHTDSKFIIYNTYRGRTVLLDSSVRKRFAIVTDTPLQERILREKGYLKVDVDDIQPIVDKMQKFTRYTVAVDAAPIERIYKLQTQLKEKTYLAVGVAAHKGKYGIGLLMDTITGDITLYPVGTTQSDVSFVTLIPLYTLYKIVSTVKLRRIVLMTNEDSPLVARIPGASVILAPLYMGGYRIREHQKTNYHIPPRVAEVMAALNTLYDLRISADNDKTIIAGGTADRSGFVTVEVFKKSRLPRAWYSITERYRILPVLYEAELIGAAYFTASGDKLLYLDDFFGVKTEQPPQIPESVNGETITIRRDVSRAFRVKDNKIKYADKEILSILVPEIVKRLAAVEKPRTVTVTYNDKEILARVEAHTYRATIYEQKW